MIKVAFVGAPDSGKTTLAKIVSARLNLQGYVPAYVHEFARDYITKYGIRPNTITDQFYVLKKQLEREDEMCSTSTQIMYTDCPLILPYVYAIDLVEDKLCNRPEVYTKDLDILADLYRETLKVTKDRYDLLFLLKPFRKTIIDDVRAQDLNRLDKLEIQIQAFLDLHGYNYITLTQNMDERIEVVEARILERLGKL